MWQLPDPRTFDSLIDLIEDAAYALRRTRADGAADRRRAASAVDARLTLTTTPSSSPGACSALGLQPGDRLLTWSPSTPGLPAVYFGAMRAGVVIVPLDLRMAPDVLQRIATAADAQWLAIGTGLDAPDPAGRAWPT